MRKMYSKNQIENIAKDVALPEIESGDAGKVLTVNEGETSAVWADVDALPEIEAGDAGKVLTVNEGETGAVWAEASGGGKLYEHNVQINAWQSGHSACTVNFMLRIVNDNNTAITASNAADIMYSLYTNHPVPVSGGAYDTADNPIVYYPLILCQAVNSSPKRLDVYHISSDGGQKQRALILNVVSDNIRELQ